MGILLYRIKKLTRIQGERGNYTYNLGGGWALLVLGGG